MDKQEFEKQYAESSGVTVEWLHQNGLFALPCECEYDKCKGWRMEHESITSISQTIVNK